MILVDPPWIPYPASLQGHGLLLERLLLVRTRAAEKNRYGPASRRFGTAGAAPCWPGRNRSASPGCAGCRSPPKTAQSWPSCSGRKVRSGSPHPPHCVYNWSLAITTARASIFSSAAEAAHLNRYGFHSLSQLTRSGAAQTQDHAPLAKNSINTTLAGHPLPAVALDLHTRGQSSTSTARTTGHGTRRGGGTAALSAWPPGVTSTATRCASPVTGTACSWKRAPVSACSGAPEHLSKRLEQELGHLGYHAMTGSAPTPEAAWLAAREGLHITSPGHVRRQLGPLPLDRPAPGYRATGRDGTDGLSPAS